MIKVQTKLWSAGELTVTVHISLGWTYSYSYSYSDSTYKKKPIWSANPRFKSGVPKIPKVMVMQCPGAWLWDKWRGQVLFPGKKWRGQGWDMLRLGECIIQTWMWNWKCRQYGVSFCHFSNSTWLSPGLRLPRGLPRYRGEVSNTMAGRKDSLANSKSRGCGSNLKQHIGTAGSSMDQLFWVWKRRKKKAKILHSGPRPT